MKKGRLSEQDYIWNSLDEAFGTPGYARFSFALGDDDIAEGISRIAELASR